MIKYFKHNNICDILLHNLKKIQTVSPRIDFAQTVVFKRDNMKL